MAVRTKPVRLFESDETALSILASTLRRSRSEVAHAALAEYMRNHRDELSTLFTAAQRAVAAGDIDGLVAAAAPALEREVAGLMADIPTSHDPA